MHSLCNSIIIFDEVQAFPVSCTALFNLAVNFLSQFCNTTVVLCSATQPTLAELKENNICQCTEMSGQAEKYAKAFKRVEIVDKTKLCSEKMEIDDLKGFALKQTVEYGSTLIIVNTTTCARKVFEKLSEECSSQEYELFHLSNNMCPENKLDVLKKIKRVLKNRTKKVICVSTQVVEAGVNFSFGCVIRSKAGLDNIIQAAGRCNRHKELGKMGVVYIVQMSETVENLSNLRDIRNAQAALQKVLDEYELNPEKFSGMLDSEAAIKAYYYNYRSQLRTDEEKFPVEICGTTTNLVELLGENKIGQKQCERKYHRKLKTKLPQAFGTAGREFEVIANDHKVSVIVPYNEEVRRLIDEYSQIYMKAEDKRRILRKLQRYTVGISETRKNQLGNAIYESNDKEILILNDGYYDENVGVLDEPQMGYLEI